MFGDSNGEGEPRQHDRLISCVAVSGVFDIRFQEFGKA
jgi:hypothetical protein